MIASFRKVNMFMTSWALEHYLAKGRPFMPEALARQHPPLLISDRPVLLPGTPLFGLLLPEDQQIIEEQYQPYWGPIRIAGAAAKFTGPGSATLRLPFGGEYRLDSPVSVRIDGRAVAPGEVVQISGDHPTAQLDVDAPPENAQGLVVRLLWAAARPPPPRSATPLDYFDGL